MFGLFYSFIYFSVLEGAVYETIEMFLLVVSKYAGFLVLVLNMV